jgi:hypothetical protein
MRHLVLARHDWSDDEKRRILEYCSTDVTGTAAFSPRWLHPSTGLEPYLEGDI